MIPLFKVPMSSDAAVAVSRVLRSGYVGQGAIVDEFEAALQREFQLAVRPITTNSCTSAIQLALMLLNVGPGDEVITTPITCTATNAPIVLAGARPIWANTDPNTGNIDPNDVAAKITGRTKAIIAVDWSGRACDYTRLRRFGIPVIQDAAHGPLTPFGGDLVCLSFGPIKHLTCGDGGALVVYDPEMSRQARLLRWYGLDRTGTKSFRCEQNIERVGTKLHMNDINASMGLANLPRLAEIVRRHRQNALLLDALIQLRPELTKPAMDHTSCWWVYTLTVIDRPSFQAYMSLHGIEASQVHARNDKHTGFHYPNGPLPGVDLFDKTQISIPCGWWLSNEEVRHIAWAVNTWNH